VSATSQTPPDIDNMKIRQSPTIDFLVRMKALDDNYVTPRDIMCLYAIIRKPGMSRQDLAHAIGVPTPANVLSNVNRLIRWNYVEDRRTVSRRASPSFLHALPDGIEFWERIKPA